jgi:hypothetical protein
LVESVDGVIEAADVGSGKFAGEIRERRAELRETGERGLADDGDGVVGREVVAVIGKGDEAEGVDEAVGGIAGDDVDLMIEKGAIEKAEVHDFRRFGEAQMVAVAQGAEAVGALEEFVADADAPFGGDWSDVGEFLEMKIFGVGTANDHGEGVFEAERLGDFEAEAIGVELLDAAVDGGGIAGRRFIEDGGEGGAGVFDVKVELAGEDGFVDKEGAAEIGLAHDRYAGFGFDVLGEELGEDDLLGEEFGADGDFGLRRFVTGGKEIEETEEDKEAKERKRSAAHG